MGHLWPCSVQVHFGVIQYTYLKWPVTRKTDSLRGKGIIEIWDSRRYQ